MTKLNELKSSKVLHFSIVDLQIISIDKNVSKYIFFKINFSKLRIYTSSFHIIFFMLTVVHHKPSAWPLKQFYETILKLIVSESTQNAVRLGWG